MNKKDLTPGKTKEILRTGKLVIEIKNIGNKDIGITKTLISKIPIAMENGVASVSLEIQPILKSEVTTLEIDCKGLDKGIDFILVELNPENLDGYTRVDESNYHNNKYVIKLNSNKTISITDNI